MFFLWTTLLILTKELLSQCTEGCLICINNTCSFCDFTNYYVYNGVTCIYTYNANCILSDTFGNCLMCSTQNYIDTTTNKCVFIKEPDISLNCESYASPTVCSSCKPNFVLTNQVCVDVTKSIQNCLVASPTTPPQCLQCAPKFVPTFNFQNCISVKTIPSNCAGMTIYKCGFCKANYVLDLNGYLGKTYAANDHISRQYLIKQMLNDAQGVLNQGVYPYCFLPVIKNCQVYLNAQQCKVCNPGYFLNSTLLCQVYPEPGIAFCVIYQSPILCTQCVGGYYPSAPGVCSTVTVIPNCLNYNTSSSTVVCLSCITVYYVNSNRCVLRQNYPIKSCSLYSPAGDSCGVCLNGYQLTSDSLACLPATPLCITYLQSSVSSTTLTCTNCINGYYHSNGKGCVLGTISNCKVWATNLNTCAVCENGYWLKDPLTCVAHNQIGNCQTYSQSSANTCAQCMNNYFLFNILNMCTPAVNIPFCEHLASSTACSRCLDGYYLSSGICLRIILPTNCLQIDSQLCVKCTRGMYIFAGLCITPPVYFASNCLVNNADGLTTFANAFCNSCAQNTYLVDYSNSYFCVATENILSSKLYSNCLSYSVDELGNYYCTRCYGNFVVSPTRLACLEQCPPGYLIKAVESFNLGETLTSNSYSRFNIKDRGICVVSTATFPNCQTIFPDLFTHNTAPGEVNYDCGVCMPTFYPVIRLNEVIYANSALNPTQAPGILSTNPVSTYPGVQCKSGASLIYNNLNVVISNCDYYYASGLYWGCYKCSFGYTGLIVNFPTLTTGYIASCSQVIPDCTTTKNEIFLLTKAELAVFQIPLGSLFSCHVCGQSNQIPFIALDFTNGITNPPLAAWGFSYTVTNNSVLYSNPNGNPTGDTTTYSNYATTYYKSGTGGSAQFCAIQQRSSFRIIQADDYGLVPNCGLGILNVNAFYSAYQATFLDPTSMRNTAVYCFACLPKFNPVRVALSNTNAPMMVYLCQPIANCLSSKWFNACTECAANFAYQWVVASSYTNYSICVSSPDPNCYVFIVETQVCKYCSKGYFLNPDRVCEIVNIKNCQDPLQQFEMVYGVSPTTDSHSLGYYLSPEGPGCVFCNLGYIAILSNLTQYICMTSAYLTRGILTANTVFPSNCLQYSMNRANLNVICGTCASNYMLTVSGKCAPILANCITATDLGTCAVCQSNYMKLQSVCVIPNIPNCQTYDYSPSGSVQVCSVCNSGYFWSSPNCVLGNIPNCAILSSEKICARCSPNYYPIPIPGPMSYCFPLAASLNCMSATNDFQNNNYACETCVTGYFPLFLTSHTITNMCLTFVPIPNCLNYNLGVTPQTSTYKCSNCISTHYLQNTACVLRTVNFMNCFAYNVTSDTCIACIPLYYLNGDGTACIPFPQGVTGCIKYSNLTTCIQCDANKFLNQTQCSDVPGPNLIANCVYYSNINTCSYCTPPFVVSGSTCVRSQALNCLTYASPTACGSCPPLFGFLISNGLTNCSPISDGNCLVYNMNFPFTCTTCKTGFYPSLGFCTAVVTTITNCITYDTATTCTNCQNPAILSVDRLSCITSPLLQANFDINCDDLSILSVPICNKCSPGSYFKNNVCSDCSVANKNSGCYACDSKNASVCLICTPGYYMNSQGSCISYTLPKNDTSVSNTTKPSTNTSSNASNNTVFVRLSTNLKAWVVSLFTLLIVNFKQKDGKFDLF